MAQDDLNPIGGSGPIGDEPIGSKLLTGVSLSGDVQSGNSTCTGEIRLHLAAGGGWNSTKADRERDRRDRARWEIQQRGYEQKRAFYLARDRYLKDIKRERDAEQARTVEAARARTEARTAAKAAEAKRYDAELDAMVAELEPIMRAEAQRIEEVNQAAIELHAAHQERAARIRRKTTVLLLAA